MPLDVRLPLGLMFIAIGGVVAFQGLVAGGSAAAAARLNIDLIWGAAMTGFGALMLALAALARRNRP